MFSEIDNKKGQLSEQNPRYENQRFVVRLLKDLIKTPLKINLFDHILSLISSWYELTFIGVYEYDVLSSHFTYLDQKNKTPNPNRILLEKILSLPTIVRPLKDHQMKLVYDLEEIKTLFLLPLFIREDFYGVMILENNGDYLSWNAEQVNLLSMIASIIDEFLFQEDQLDYQQNNQAFEEIPSAWSKLDSNNKNELVLRFMRNQMCFDYVMNTTHEIRNSLNAIIGLSSVLQDSILGSLNPEQYEMVKDICNNGKFIQNWIMRVESNMQMNLQDPPLEKTEIDISLLFGEIQSFFQYQIDIKKVILKTEISNKNSIIWGNSTFIIRILTSILNRIIRDTSESEIIILKSEIQGDAYSISVQNDLNDSFVPPIPWDVNNNGENFDLFMEISYWRRFLSLIKADLQVNINSKKKLQFIIRISNEII